jgi:hypothetical protein
VLIEGADRIDGGRMNAIFRSVSGGNFVDRLNSSAGRKPEGSSSFPDVKDSSGCNFLLFFVLPAPAGGETSVSD